MASLRRLAKDHAALQSALPPNYLSAEDGYSDDLTQLVVLVTGAEGTPYALGLWRLHLKIPTDYPKSPPKATFKTRIYHPNVDEKTGAVCLETLKRDWDPKLTLKDILITISCLLIQPNPDSALNAAAGGLIQEDYGAFSTQARLMTKIHAPIPKQLSAAVREAKRRGEEVEQEAERLEELVEDDTKENDPSRSSNSSICPRASPQSQVRGKRPLSELPLPEDQEGGALVEEPKRKSPRTIRSDAPDPGRSPQATISVDGTEELLNLNHGEREDVAKSTRLHPRSSLASGPAPLRKGSSVGATRRCQPRVGIRRL